MLALRVLGAKDETRVAALAGDIEALGIRIFTPSSVVLGLTGIGLVLNGNWDWSEPFISVGLLVWLVSVAAGVGYLGPTSGKIKAEMDAGGMTSRAHVADRQRVALLTDRARAALDRRVHDGRQARQLAVERGTLFLIACSRVRGGWWLRLPCGRRRL